MKRKWSKQKVGGLVLTRVFLVTVFLQFVFVYQGIAEEKDEPRLSAEFNKTSFTEVLKFIKLKTSYDFLYDNDEIHAVVPVTAKFRDVTVKEILDYCLKDSKLQYRITHNVIVISRRTDPSKANTEEMVIRGKVLDQDNALLPGATVQVKGLKVGVATDKDGVFVLRLPKMDSVVLVVQFLGMVTKEVHVSDVQKEVVCRLVEDKVGIDEVVVTGYNTIRKSSFTGNAINISAEELLKVSKTNVIQALQAFDPSFRIRENNAWGSDPNALPEISIRGLSGIGVKDLDRDALSKSSLKGNPNLPVFIMDGFEVSIEKIYDLDPNRISSTTILKDAAATALYGSRAANGVVVITTVAPKEGKITVSYNLVGNLTMPDLTDYNLMNAEEKLEAEVRAKMYEPQDPNMDDWTEKTELDQQYNAKLENIRRGVDTYWLSKPLRTVFNHKHSLFIEGGSETIRFGLDLNYNNQDGVMKESVRNRYGVGFSLDYRLKSLQIRNYISYGVVKSKESPYGSFGDYTTKLPYDEYKDKDGNMLESLKQWNAYVDAKNPLYEATIGNYTKDSYNELIDNLSVNWYITSALQFKGQFSITQKTSEYDKFIHPDSRQNAAGLNAADKGQLDLRRGESVSWNTNLLLAYNQNVLKHNINFTAGLNIVSNSDESTSSSYRGFANGNLHSPNYAKEIVTKPVTNDSKSRLFGILSNLNYSYNDIYLFDASFRVDGSSEFGSDRRFAPFWAVGAGLNLHNYGFVKDLGFMDLLKIRGSYGQTGKVNFPAYSAISSHTLYIDDWYATGMGSTLMMNMGNKSLKWEKTNKIDAGIEVGILKNLFYLQFTYYSEKTDDLITDVTLPSSTGFTSYKDNLGKVKNDGFEISVRSNVISKKDWYLSVFANLAHNENKILKISEALKAYNQKVEEYYNKPGNDLSKVFTRYEEGQSLTAKYGMKSLGIDPATGGELFMYRNGKVGYDWSAAENVVIGDEASWGQGSFGFNLRYKDFTLYTTFMYEFGGDRYNSTLVNQVENADIYGRNVDRRVLDDRWQEPGDIATLKNIADRKVQTQPTSRFMQKYNVLSLNSLTFGYELPASVLTKLGLTRALFEVGANEIWRISTVKAERGLYYPYANTVNLSLKVSF